MSVRDLKQRADEQALAASRLRLERNAHMARSIAILRERLGSPGGLVLCFTAGFVLGQPSSRDRDRELPPRTDRDADGAAGRLLMAPLAAAVIRLASAFLAGAATGPGRYADPGSSVK